MPFAVLALIAAIKEYPTVNSAMDEEGNLHVYQDVHLGVAVDTPKGLFVPVVKNAESLNLAGLAKAIADVARRTRDGKIGPDELSGSTISSPTPAAGARSGTRRSSTSPTRPSSPPRPSSSGRSWSRTPTWARWWRSAT